MGCISVLVSQDLAERFLNFKHISIHGREITKNLFIIHFSGNGPDVGFDGQDGKIPGI